jgi:endonuclease III
MNLTIPDVTSTLDKLMDVESTFNGLTQTISMWICQHRKTVKENIKLIEEKSDKNDIAVLNIFLRDLLVRAIKGEMGTLVHNQLLSIIMDKADLLETNYRTVLKNANYRWGVDKGSKVIVDVVNHVESCLHWDWGGYINNAEENKDINYQNDPMLTIKNVGFKVRDLALSNFSLYYAAFDLHVTRVITRLGWLNYGFNLIEHGLEMGTNPDDHKNYLFLHKLLFSLSAKTNGKYTPVDIDRIFWHLGKTLCGAKTECDKCPIADVCLTGKAYN